MCIAFILLILLVPIENTFNLLGIISTILLLTLLNSFLYRLSYTIYSRFQVNFIPDENRNAIYSLIPTLTTALSIPLFIVMGIVIDSSDIIAGIIIIMVIGLISASCFIILTVLHNNQFKITKKERIGLVHA